MKLQTDYECSDYVKKHSSFKRREESRNNGAIFAEIRERAFEIHIEACGIHGCDLDDWLQAEREIQKSTTRATMGGRKRNDQHIDTIVLASQHPSYRHAFEENRMLKSLQRNT